MANKKIFSYGNNGKRKIGHSKFDMGHEHIMSANFGGLHPAACFETLPDDYWDISDNTVTLLKPMTAPAFTRINQNFYAAYVRNQQIWKYWNDYISNGTAFGDVYGNNVTNQALQNAWDVPSIPTPYLQTILKAGFGNATPVFTFYQKSSADGGGASYGTLARMICQNASFYNAPPNVAARITDLFYLLLNADPENLASGLRSQFYIAKDISLADYAFDVWMYYDGTEYHFLFSFYCSLRQWLTLASAFNIITTGSQTLPNPTTIGENISDDYKASGSDISFVDIELRFFADRISPEPKTSSSAFVHEKSDYQSEEGDFLKSIDFYPRVIDTSVSVVGFKLYTSGLASQRYAIFQCISSPYWGFRYTFDDAEMTGDYRILPDYFATSSFNSSTDFYWSIDAVNKFGITSFQLAQSFFESLPQTCHYLGVAQKDYIYGLDMFHCSSSTSYPLTVLKGTSSDNGYYCARGFGNYYSAALGLTEFKVDATCDLSLHFMSTMPAGSVYGHRPSRSFASRDSLAMGYDSVSMFFYLCRQSSQLMDDFGIKVDPLSQRPFDNYRFELTNALPFFAYSKIWHDNFRNSVVSSPELDYSESNGPIFADSNFYSNFVFPTGSVPFFKEPSVRPSRYVNKVASDFTANGWTLEITTFPRNSQGQKIHTHLPVSDFFSVLSLLTGHNFDFYFNTLSSIALNVYDYYMPSYYNGLLHLKYQNFNKDYFTSALLDPMSGANQVAVGSTINELRQAEVEQHWWERTAMYRSIKSWFEGTYGITPIELPEDSRITGTDHIDVNIGEVIQTSGSSPESPQGTRTGLGGCRGSGTLCHGHANEHGWIIVLVSHTIESQYLQTYDKMWDVKESFLDYPTIDFAGIGNESILEKELNYTTVPTSGFDFNYNQFSSNANFALQYLPTISSSHVRYRGRTNPIRQVAKYSGKFNITSGAGTSLDNTFGFIPRYSSYKFKFDQVSGQFRHELNFWHTFKRYLTNPILCHEFVNWEMAADDDDINRIFAVSDDFLDDKFAIDCFINASVDRALPFVCVPMSR